LVESWPRPDARLSAEHAPRRTVRSALVVLAIAVVIGAISMIGSLAVGANTRAHHASHHAVADQAGPDGQAGPDAQGDQPADGPAIDEGTPDGAPLGDSAIGDGVAVAPPAPGAPGKPLAAPPQPFPGPEGAVLALVNQERAKAGCKALTMDSRLTAAARGHSADMAAKNYFDHTSQDGTAFADRIKRAGYQWSTAGENIAKGQKDAASVMTSWMNSPGHRANILNCAYKNIGIGLAYDAKRTPYWTQDFAAPR